MSTQRRSRLLFVAALAAALIGAMLLPATASAKADKVEICHRGDDGTFKVHTVSDNALPAHLAHGDLVVSPDADTPCVPLLAVAYSNLDGIPGFNPVTDVLIAKFVDVNGDGMPSDNDKVVTYQYPEDLGASSFGFFGVGEHVLSSVTSPSATSAKVEVTSTEDGVIFEFRFESSSHCESYTEGAVVAEAFTFFEDCTSGSDPLETDSLETDSDSPSEPGTVLFDDVFAGGDAPFIDVDIFPFTPPTP
jgi:hypothetical protein